MKRNRFFTPLISALLTLPLLILNFYSLTAQATGSRCEDLDIKSIQKSISSSLPNEVQISVEKSYVEFEGEIKAQKIIFYKSAEYEKAASQDQIPVNSILIVDELPLRMDLPFVSALIIGRELLLETTHIQVLADKMGIPLLFSPGAFYSQELREFSSRFQSFDLICSQGPCRIVGSPTLFIPKPKIQSVLPKNFKRDDKKLYNIDTERLNTRTPRELSGDKFFELMNFKMAFPKRVPDIASISSGYFETFVKSFAIDGFILKRHFYDLQRDLKRANEANDEESIKNLLSAFQYKILNSSPEHKGYDVFEEIMFELESYYYQIYKENINTAFSIRSNQDVEDLIAAGLYKSTVARALLKAEFEKNIRKSWASLYDYRAYTIRRYWGQREHNLSTPLMVHPFIDNIMSHSLGVFKINAQNQLSLDINMVLGNNEKATNPTDQARVAAFTLVELKNGNYTVVYKSSFQKLSVADQKQIQKDVIPAIKSFLSEIAKYVRNDFIERVYTPTGIHIEFVVKKADSIFKQTDLLVLQYKPSLNREVVLDLLNGLLDREDTDRKISNKNKVSTLPNLINELQLKTVEETIPRLYNELAAQNKSSSPRYALVLEGRKPKLIVWSTPMYHESVKRYLNGSQWKWLKSGYIKLMTRSGSNKPFLMFTETTDDGTDVDLQLSVSQPLFEQALLAAISDSPLLKQLLGAQQPEIIFQTYEGQVTLPPLVNP